MKLLARLVTLVSLALAALAGPAAAQGYSTNEYVDHPPPLIERLTPDVLAIVWPDADPARLEPVAGPPVAVAVHGEDGAVLGYIFSTLDIVRARGFVITPFDLIAGVTVGGTITGATKVFTRDSYIYNNERRTEQLQRFLSSLVGLPYNRLIEGDLAPNFVAGATISARTGRAAVSNSARQVMTRLVGVPEVTEPAVDRESFEPRGMLELMGAGAIAERVITNGEVADALAAAGAPPSARLDMPLRDPDEVYVEFRVALASAGTIGRNLITSQSVHDRLALEWPAGSNYLMFGSTGRYNHQGVKYQNASADFLLDRVNLVQNGTTYAFHGPDYIRSGGELGFVNGVVVIPPESTFDPLQPFTVNLFVHATASDGTVTTVAFPVDYQLPAEFILLPPPPPVPAWVETWQEARIDVVILAVALTILTLIFVFQDRLTRYRRVHRWVRNVFLLFTLVWLGYVAGGQLSIIHISNFIKAPFENVDIGFYLAEPLIIIVAVYAAISLILIGRGVFCGWLCPFGALQEFAFKIGRFLKLPEINPSARVQKWMWLPKYGIAAFILGTAFIAPEVSAATTEVEPFKTAITSAFTRPWPYITYAVLLLAIGMFSERAYCRFLCPLGATFALLDRLHLVNLLKRRPECGSPCHLCERSCPVKAITPAGKIITSECFQCLDCQVEYHDDQRCPPLAKDRKKRLREAARPAGIGQPVPAFARNAGTV